MRPHVSVSIALLGVFLTASPAVLAQKSGGTKPKTDTKSDSKSSGEGAKADAKTDAASTDAPASDADKKDDAKKTDAKETVEPPHDEWDNTNVEEVPGKSYFFVGLRYRGDIIPKFMINLFVDEGATVYSNTVGIEFDLRKDGFSLVPALSFQEYGTDDILFKQKNKPDIPGNYTVVNSGMKAIYATADLLWSSKMSKNVEFEYGVGLGIGAVFGPLKNNWVQEDSNGKLHGSNGKNYSECPAPGAPNTGCNRADHQNSDVDKVQGYTEPSWFDGGSKPVIFPWISLPQLGLRFKPVKQFVGRLNLGFSLTGFWFGFSGEYGLEQKPKP